jgi:hypothetical protein
VIVARPLPVGPPFHIASRACSIRLLSVRLGPRLDPRSGWLNEPEVGEQVRELRGRIAAVAEREAGETQRGTAVVGAGTQSAQDRHRASRGRRYPSDPHGRETGEPDFRWTLHDDAVFRATEFWGCGIPPQSGGQMNTPSNPTPQNAGPRPQLEARRSQRRRGAYRNRTGVNGFAGRCVATPPRRRLPESLATDLTDTESGSGGQAGESTDSREEASCLPRGVDRGRAADGIRTHDLLHGKQTL